MIGQSSNSLRTSKGLKIHFNSRHKGLYIVLAFFALLLVTGGTIALTTGKIVNPFNKAGWETTEPICVKSTVTNVKNTTRIPVDEKYCNGKEENQFYTNCAMEYPTDEDAIFEVNGTCYCDKTTNEQKQKCLEWGCPAGYVLRHDASSGGALICVKTRKASSPKPTSTPTPTPKPTQAPKSNAAACKYKPTYNACVQCCNQAYPDTDDAFSSAEAAQDRQECIKSCPKSTTPTTPNQSHQCPEGTHYSAINGFCVANPPATPLPTSDTNTNDTNTNITSNNSSTTSSSNTRNTSCNPNYKIPIEISSVTVTQNNCNSSTGEYTVTYTIKIHAQGISGECGGGHFDLTVTYPSGVQSTDIVSASPALNSKSGNIAKWTNRYVWDNSNQTFTIKAIVPKSHISSRSFKTIFTLTPQDHTTNGGTMQTSKVTDPTASCVYTSSTNTTPTPTPTPTATGEDNNTTGEDNTNAYIPPNTGLLDEHPILIVAGIAILGILESAFGLFSNTLVKIKNFVD